jgi:hypothetical protein
MGTSKNPQFDLCQAQVYIWKAQVLKDLDTFQAYNKLDKASTERAALVYAFEVCVQVSSVSEISGSNVLDLEWHPQKV